MFSTWSEIEKPYAERNLDEEGSLRLVREFVVGVHLSSGCDGDGDGDSEGRDVV